MLGSEANAERTPETTEPAEQLSGYGWPPETVRAGTSKCRQSASLGTLWFWVGGLSVKIWDV